MLVLTIDEGFGTIYDRIWKANILKSVKAQYGLDTITEVGVGIPIIESGGVGLDTLLVGSSFSRIQFVDSLYENIKYAGDFFAANDIPYRAFHYKDFMHGECVPTDLLFGNYILEFTDDLATFIKTAKNMSTYMLFFESNHLNFGHSLVKVLGEKFMIAPWVTHKSVRKTTPTNSINLLNGLGVKVIGWGMIDFPFFAPASGVSPFKTARARRGKFSLKPIDTKANALIKVGFGIERVMPDFFRYFSHMFYVVVKNENPSG